MIHHEDVGTLMLGNSMVCVGSIFPGSCCYLGRLGPATKQLFQFLTMISGTNSIELHGYLIVLVNVTF